MLKKGNEYTYPAYIKSTGDKITVIFPSFPELHIDHYTSRRMCFLAARRALQDHAEKLMRYGYVLPYPDLFPSDDPNLGELIFLTIYCEPPGFYWRKPFLDCCIVYTMFIVCLMFLLGGVLTPFLFLGWLILLSGMLLLTGVISLFSHSIHDSLSYGKVSLFKRLISILGLCVVAACLTWLLWNSGIK